ncbi:MAG TPA: cytochrome c oxidase subunit II [Lacipirellulaceae bacterium]|nr:cytochrome c oxidase subunit II [Lacipirellulaceae bacterium]
MNSEFQLFPDSASTTAPPVDRIYWFMVALSAVMTLAIAASIVYLAIRYRRHAKVDRTQPPTSLAMELTWIALSLPLLVGIYIWGAKVGFFLLRPPENASPVTVVAKQWMWKFQHANGRREIDVLHVPVGKPVRLTMISQDVIHSFYVPAFRIKQDVLPGRYTSAWFQPTAPGRYRIYCAEYCGTNHSRMVGYVVAQTPSDYVAWLNGEADASEPMEVTGEKLFEQHQCASCHRRDGTTGRGPTLHGVFGAQVALNGGATVVADQEYLRESILRPAAKVVAGYQPIMPSYQGQISEEGIVSLIAYIKSLGGEGAAGAAPGAAP